MSEGRRPVRRSRGQSASATASATPDAAEPNPYREDAGPDLFGEAEAPAARKPRAPRRRAAAAEAPEAPAAAPAPAPAADAAPEASDAPAAPRARRTRAPRKSADEGSAEVAPAASAPAAPAAPTAPEPAADAPAEDRPARRGRTPRGRGTPRPAFSAEPRADDDGPQPVSFGSDDDDRGDRAPYADGQRADRGREERRPAAASDASPGAPTGAPTGEAPADGQAAAPNAGPYGGYRNRWEQRRAERFERRRQRLERERLEREQGIVSGDAPADGAPRHEQRPPQPQRPPHQPKGQFQQRQGGQQGQGGPQQGGQFRDDGFQKQGRRRRQRGRFRDRDGQPQDGSPQGGYAPPGGYQQPQGGYGQGGYAQGGPPDAGRQGWRQVTPEQELAGWVDVQKDGSGFVRQAQFSYLPGPADPFIPVAVVRQHNLRKGDRVETMVGRDHRNRFVVCEVQAVNGAPPDGTVKRPDFQALLATYPERKLRLETGKVAARGAPELTRRVVDLIAPIGFGQRALIVAPARSGKTMLLQAIVEGVALNHKDAELIVLLVDERPEEVSEMVQVGYGEVVASSFDMPAERHREVVDMVMHRAHRLVELGRDVVIVLDSITRMARAFNATMRGPGRTMSGGLDSNAMAKPKAFFGSARAVAPRDGGGSLTIIGTALVETGSRMDDVIFEEFKGTGNCEIKLDRSLAEKRIFPAIDIPASGTRREDKLFKPEQLDAVYVLRRGLQNMPAEKAMEWLTKRIAATPSNDVLLAALLRDATA